jgi:hypothetical protein
MPLIHLILFDRNYNSESCKKEWKKKVQYRTEDKRSSLLAWTVIPRSVRHTWNTKQQASPRGRRVISNPTTQCHHLSWADIHRNIHQEAANTNRQWSNDKEVKTLTSWLFFTKSLSLSSHLTTTSVSPWPKIPTVLGLVHPGVGHLSFRKIWSRSSGGSYELHSHSAWGFQNFGSVLKLTFSLSHWVAVEKV